MSILQSRRNFVSSVSGACAAGLIARTLALAEDGPPETDTIRLLRNTSICQAPGFIVEDLLREEGFQHLRFVTSALPDTVVGRGETDFDLYAPAILAYQLDAGEPLVAVGGIHAGCYELFAHEPIRAVRDLKGRTVGVGNIADAGYVQTAVMAAEVGLNPLKDIVWVTGGDDAGAMELFIQRKVDAVNAFPPVPQELRARKIGRMIASMTVDKPWSQYLCCLVTGNREFVRKYPNATKRFLRATLKAADLCAARPDIAVQRLIDGGFTDRYDLAFQTLTELPYAAWRDFDVEDSLRFYANRLYAVGLIKSNPRKIVAEGADWRFFNELKRELKV